MRGHWISATRKLNRHYQSGRYGGWLDGGSITARLRYFAVVRDNGTRFTNTASGWDIKAQGGIPLPIPQSFTKGQKLRIRVSCDTPGVYLTGIFLTGTFSNWTVGYKIQGQSGMKLDYSIDSVQPAQVNFPTVLGGGSTVQNQGALLDGGVELECTLPQVTLTDWLEHLRLQIYADASWDDRWTDPGTGTTYKRENPVTISIKVRSEV